MNVKLASATERGPDAAMELDPQGVCLCAGSSAPSLLGLEPGDMVGIPLEKLVHPDDAQPLREAWERVGRGESLRGIALRARAGDGRILSLLFDLVPRRGRGGVFLGADAWARREPDPDDPPGDEEGGALAALDRLARFARQAAAAADAQAVLEAAAQALAQLGARASWTLLREPDSGELEATACRGPGARELAEPVAEATRGTEPPEPTAQALDGRLAVVELEGLEGAWAEAARARGYRSLAVLPLAWGGETLGVAHAYSREAEGLGGWRRPLLEALAATASAALGAARASRRAERAKSRFEGLVEGLPCVVYTAEPCWPPRFRYISRNVEKYTGCSAEDFLEDRGTLLAVIHPEDRERVAAEVRRRGPLPEPYMLEVRVVDARTGAVTHAAIHSQPQLDAQGRVVLRHGIITDVTERKRLEQELRQSQRLAAVGEMAAMMAHEIRNPLAGMSLAVRTLRSAPREPEVVEECLVDLDQCLQRINATVSRVLEFSKARPLAVRPTSLEEVVRSAARLTATYIRKNDIRLHLELASDLPPLVADPDQLEQVFVNLILNACQAMPEGGELRLRAELEAGRVHAQVADTGVGIEPQHLEAIFDPFYSRFANGTGLGLPLCRRIVEAHGGSIAVESTPGEGSTFHIHIPLEHRDGSGPGG
ncbi:MAG: ATP-binding protein [Candidatus Brocadiia bacterium]